MLEFNNGREEEKMKKYVVITDMYKKKNRFKAEMVKGKSADKVLEVYDRNDCTVSVTSIKEAKNLALQLAIITEVKC